MSYPLTPYQITVWKLSGRDDAVESRVECYAETEWQCIELFDMLTRGIQGHYRAKPLALGGFPGMLPIPHQSGAFNKGLKCLKLLSIPGLRQ